ncbi:MAG: UvrD-helicase domain-containing protein [Pseudomonadota bacterium]
MSSSPASVPLPPAAYAIDGRPVPREAFYAAACDPRRSIVVEACAGAGKTWLLVSRILRALLDGAEPSQIVAITFTRKAAGEMRARLEEWLSAFAVQADALGRGGDAARAQALVERGLDAATAAAQAGALGALPLRVLQAAAGVQVLTFHAWFAQLLTHSPLGLRAALGLPARHELIEEVGPLRAPLLRRFHDRVRRDAGLRSLYAGLVQRHGRASVLAWIEDAWRAAGDLARAEAAQTLADTVPPAAALWPQCEGLDDPAELLAEPAARAQLAALARELGRSPKVRPQQAAAGLVAALEALDALESPDTSAAAGPGQATSAGATPEAAPGAAACDPGAAFGLAWSALFTDEGAPRKQLGDSMLRDEVVGRLQEMQQMRAQQWAHVDHRSLVLLSRVLLDEYAALKRERGLVDMNDLERVAQQLLGDGAHAAWLQERLDLRLRHLLIDEFQDTSPAQWQVLRGWLESYAGAGGGASGQRPLALFFVGDPKQSIYRFRGAEPRVFAAARDLVVGALDGLALSCDHTRRSAQEVVDAVNAVFGPLAAASHSDDGALAFGPFRHHTTEVGAGGAVWRLPRLPRPQRAGGGVAERWRDSLPEPRREPEQQARAAEAAQAARAVAALVDPRGPWRLGPGEVMVLARRRVALGEMATALAALGVPHALAEPLDLAQVPEVLDLVAVLDVLVSPGHDLALARALRSPLFGADDEALLALAAAARGSAGRADGLATAAGAGAAEGAAAAHGASGANGAAGAAAAGSAEGVRGTAGTPATAQGRHAAPVALPWLEVLLAQPWPDRPALERARGLLAAWREWVLLLPPHDMLDRICQDCDAMARYAAAVPPARRDFALQALGALLEAALEHEGGRFASAYRFVRDLRAGRVRAQRPTAAAAVRLLTVHGAKGLEARAVLLLDCDAAPPADGGATLLVDWPAEAAAPRAAAFVRSEAHPAPSLQPLCAQRRAEAGREELNALYVAMTRARQWLIVSAVAPARSGDGPSWWDRLAPHAQPWEPAAPPGPTAAGGGGGEGSASAAGPAASPKGAAAAMPAPARPEPQAAVPVLRPWRGTAAAAADPAEAAAGDAAPSSPAGALGAARDPAAARLGQALHRVLEWAGAAPERWSLAQRDAACDAAAAGFGLQAAAAALLRSAVAAILGSADSAPFFDRAALRWAGAEVSLGQDGEVMRPDRVVLLDTPGGPQWWVLDYKLEAEPQRDPALRAQLGRYAAALAAAQPGAVVRAAFVTGAGVLVELRPEADGAA